MEDPDFRARLLANPRATIENDTGLVFPEGCEINVVEDTPTTTTLVLPVSTPELTEQQLEAVVGGLGTGPVASGGWCYHVDWLKNPTPGLPQT